ncbi:hypothetical protein J7K18_08415 [bacterium]|nr:hypothetical protein [bacterium]
MEKESIEWVFFPIKERPEKGVIGVLILLFVFFFSTWYMENIAFGGIFSLVAFLSLLNLFFPTRFTLTKDGVKKRLIGIVQFKEWKHFKSFYPDKNGVLLSPFKSTSWLENFRGMYLNFSGNREEVIEFVKAHIKED